VMVGASYLSHPTPVRLYVVAPLRTYAASPILSKNFVAPPPLLYEYENSYPLVMRRKPVEHRDPLLSKFALVSTTGRGFGFGPSHLLKVNPAEESKSPLNWSPRPIRLSPYRGIPVPRSPFSPATIPR